MGWWETGQGDDVIGDGPADAVSATLEAFAARREGQGRLLPTLEDLLDALASAMGGHTEWFLDGSANISVNRLSARLGPEPREISSRDPLVVDPELVAALEDAFQEIAAEYEETELERKPRLTELLATFAFVLAYEPEEYLAGAEGVSVQEIAVA